MPEKQIVCGKLYASWCHYCKELKGPWKQVIEMLQRDKSLVCVSKEVALGDVQDEQKQQEILKSLTQQLNAKQDIAVKGGYPTIFKLDPFYNVVYYEGPRTVEALYEFFSGKSAQHPGDNTVSKRRRKTTTGGCWWSKPKKNKKSSWSRQTQRKKRKI